MRRRIGGTIYLCPIDETHPSLPPTGEYTELSENIDPL